VGLQPFAVINQHAMKTYEEFRTWTESLDKRPKLLNMDMRLVTWTVRILYRGGGLSDGRVVAPNLWENTHFSLERGMRIMN
jgi:hypothetical protein